jgi:hypothetical protein
LPALLKIAVKGCRKASLPYRRCHGTYLLSATIECCLYLPLLLLLPSYPMPPSDAGHHMILFSNATAANDAMGLANKYYIVRCSRK